MSRGMGGVQAPCLIKMSPYVMRRGWFERKGCTMGVLKFLMGVLFLEIWGGDCLGRDKNG